MIRKRLARIATWVLSQAPFSTQQWVTVSISFVLAVTLWFLVTINTQTYTTDFRLPVRLVNFPGEYQLIEDFPEAIEIQTSGQGIKLLYEVFNKDDTLSIDFLDYQGKDYFIGHQNLEIVDAILEEGVKTLSISPDSVSFRKLKKDSKRVPVVLATTWNLPSSYRISGIVRPNPDSVTVTGPVDSLALIDSWSTASMHLPLIDVPTTIDLPLDFHPPFQVVPSEVSVHLNPEPYTEVSYLLPLRTNNTPRFTEVYFEPDSVRVKFLVPLRLADSIRINDFLVDVDHTQIDARSPYAIANLAKHPAGIELVGIFPARVKYLIISKVK